VKLLLPLLVASLSTLSAADVLTTFDDGTTVKERFQTDSTGAKNGSYQSYYHSGKTHARGAYRKGKQDGSWTTLDEQGKTLLSERFANGLLAGPYVKNHPNGRPWLKASYAKGELSSPIRVFDADGQEVREVTYPYSLDHLATVMATLMPAPLDTAALYADPPSTKAPYASGTLSPAGFDQALHTLQLFRFLAGAPWESLTVNPTTSVTVQKASTLLAIGGAFTHDPAKPADMDDDFFNQGMDGINHSVMWQAGGDAGMVVSIQKWMEDPDVDCTHRRLLLNPSLTHVGFGFTAPFALTYIAEGMGDDVSGDPILYPGPGYFPQQFFTPTEAWLVLLKGTKSDLGSAHVQITVNELDENYGVIAPVTVPDPKIITDVHYPTPAIVFHPQLTVIDGKRFQVDITIDANGGGPDHLSYMVDFVAVPLPAHSPLPAK